MAWNFFKKSKKKDQDNNESNSLEKKINDALRNAQNDKQEAEKEIEKIKSWTTEVIIDTYADMFPNGHLTYYRERYKKNALENYEKIKIENEDKISRQEVEKCDKIVNGYLNQIALRESKLKLYAKIESEYLKTKQKLKQTKLQEINNDKLDAHEERLKKLDSDTGAYVDATSDTAELDELKREFELKEEYVKQLALLSDKYDTDSKENYNNATAFKEEIDRMTDDI